MERAKEYIEMPTLTPELLRTFIRRIEVYEKPEKTGCTFSFVKNPFWEMVCDGFTIKCLNLHKLKYAICESRIRLVC